MIFLDIFRLVDASMMRPQANVVSWNKQKLTSWNGIYVNPSFSVCQVSSDNLLKKPSRITYICINTCSNPSLSGTFILIQYF